MRLGDLDELEKEVHKSLELNPHGGKVERGMHVHEHRHFLCLISSSPTINPEDLRPKGKWEPLYEQIWNVVGEVVVGYRCSVCGREEQYPELYCHCGAKMEEE